MLTDVAVNFSARQLCLLADSEACLCQWLTDAFGTALIGHGQPLKQNVTLVVSSETQQEVNLTFLSFGNLMDSRYAAAAYDDE